MTSMLTTHSGYLPATRHAQPLEAEASQASTFVGTALRDAFEAYLPSSPEAVRSSRSTGADQPAGANKRVGDAMAAQEADTAATPVQGQAINRDQVGSRESVAGVPKRMDLGPALIHTFQILRQKYQKADALVKAVTEWHTEGPSERAAKRLEPLLAGGAAFGPGVLAAAGQHASDGTPLVGQVVIDALMLHLIDRGDHAKLVQGYIDSLKRTGDYDSMVAKILVNHPDKTRDWAEALIEKGLSVWDGPFPAEWLPPGDRGAPQYMDDEQRLAHFIQLLNPDARPEERRRR